MLGIGSGINVLMLGVEWQTSLIAGRMPSQMNDPLAVSR
jgi:hypothetical protein